MGGDLAGKAFVPIVEGEDGQWHVHFQGRDEQLSVEQLLETEQAIRLNGMYPFRTTPAELQRLGGDEALQGGKFSQVLAEELQRWCKLADERLNGETQALVMCGNDDPFELDSILKSSSRLSWCDEQIVEVGGHEVLSLSYANRTPWNSPRELEEEDLYVRISRLADQLQRPQSAIFNLHVPPLNSGLDTATRLDADLRPVLSGGTPEQTPVGSVAVREAIERYQPLVSLHGHIHESRGIASIGRTVAINPGSDYASGRLHGCLLRLTPEAILSAQLVMG
jgi:Icc-related predicted phosphoesterase